MFWEYNPNQDKEKHKELKMDSSINLVISQSCMQILRPLIRILLRNGVSCKSFEELARKAYVDEAFAIAEKSKKKTTVSCVSGQTGLSRKEVKRLHELELKQCEKTEEKYNRSVRVISGWVNDAHYLDTKGKAKMLTNSEFSELVKQYSGDITPKAMQDLLLDAKCINVENGGVSLIKQAYLPGKDSIDIMRILGADTKELLNTIDYNLTHTDCKRFQRKVSTTLLNKDSLTEFKELSQNLSQNLLEQLDEWITKHEVPANHANAIYISLGIYFYENNTNP